MPSEHSLLVFFASYRHSPEPTGSMILITPKKVLCQLTRRFQSPKKQNSGELGLKMHILCQAIKQEHNGHGLAKFINYQP
jgi:hypothetical protein